MENLEIYNKLSITPIEARKEIQAGRLKGMTDINPMWRIKALTETFGICGIGWKYVITSKKLENGCKGQISAFVDIDLFIKVDGVWSDAIQGTGGASFVTEESKGLYQSDECYKMALTDAIGISCKALGMSADIYFSKDRTKYDVTPKTNDEKPIKVTRWLGDNAFVEMKEKSKDDIKKYLDYYDGKTVQDDLNVYGMKKEFRTELEKLIK
jgi:hypothetical protein